MASRFNNILDLDNVRWYNALDTFKALGCAWELKTVFKISKYIKTLNDLRITNCQFHFYEKYRHCFLINLEGIFCLLLNEKDSLVCNNFQKCVEEIFL